MTEESKEVPENLFKSALKLVSNREVTHMLAIVLCEEMYKLVAFMDMLNAK